MAEPSTMNKPALHRVRLRLHHGGTFKKDPETGECRYTGGSVFNDAVPQSFKYDELCFRVNQKVGEPVSIKYQAPGEDLDVESLISVADDDDLQELVNEYMDALQRRGAQTRTFRIHVFLQPALQFEIERTEATGGDHEGHFAPSEEDMEPSLCCHDVFDDISEAFSCDPSSDTEWQVAHTAQAQEAFTTTTSKMAGLHFAADQITPEHGMTSSLATPAMPVRWEAGMEDHALSNLNRSLQAYPVLVDGHAAGSQAAFTADDFDVEDPYMEDAVRVGVGAASRVPAAAQRVLENGDAAQGKMAEPSTFMNGSSLLLKGAPLSNRPLDRVRDAANGLPSHISAFGEGYSCGSAAAEPGKNGSVKLPSHISAFGDGNDGNEMPRPDVSGQDLADPQERGGQWHASHCITQDFTEHSHSGPPSQGGLNEAPSCPTPKAVLLDSVQHVARSQVSATTKIGEGAFGEVSCADVFPYGTVAIKWLKKDRFAKYSESFQREAEVLARLNHPNIIRMFGLVTEPAVSPPSSAASTCMLTPSDANSGSKGENIIAGIMMEYLRGGSLAQRFSTLSQAGRRIGLKERCRIALQAALGMSYLHDQSPAVIHFDLKPDNLLLEGEGDALLVKVADFGLSKHKIQSYVTCHDLRGTLPYMAPELVRCPNQVCEKCDVWSMGVVMWEMVTLEVPFQELTAQDILRGLMQGSLHLRMPSTCEPEWQQLITACMESEPSARPTFRQLAERLENIGKRLTAAQVAAHQAAQQHDLMQAAQQQAVQAAAVVQQQQQQQQLFVHAQQQVPLQHQPQAYQQPPMALAQAQALLYAHQVQQQVQVQHMQQQVQGMYGDPTAAALAMGHDLMTHLYATPASQHHLAGHHLVGATLHSPLGLHHPAAPFPMHH